MLTSIVIYDKMLLDLSKNEKRESIMSEEVTMSRLLMDTQNQLALTENLINGMNATLIMKDQEIELLKKVLDGLHCRCTNCSEYEKFPNASPCDICKRYICHSCQDEFEHNYPDSGRHTLCENHAIEAGTISLEELVAYLLANSWTRHQGTNKKVWVFTAPDKYGSFKPIRLILPVNDRYVDTYKKIEDAIILLTNLGDTTFQQVRLDIKRGTHK